MMEFQNPLLLTATLPKGEGFASRLIIPPPQKESSFLVRWKTKLLNYYVSETRLDRRAPLTSRDILKSLEDCASGRCDHSTRSLSEPRCSLLKALVHRTSSTVLSNDLSTKLNQLLELLSDPLAAAISMKSSNSLMMEYLCWRLPEEVLSTTVDIDDLLKRMTRWSVGRWLKEVYDLNYAVPFIMEFLERERLGESMIPMKCPRFGPGVPEPGLTDIKDNGSSYSMTTEEDYPSDYSSDCWISIHSKSPSREDSPAGSRSRSMSPATETWTSGTRSPSPTLSMSQHCEEDFM